MMRRLFQRLEAWFMAVTFAEAGEHATARHYSDARPATTPARRSHRLRRTTAH